MIWLFSIGFVVVYLISTYLCVYIPVARKEAVFQLQEEIHKLLGPKQDDPQDDEANWRWWIVGYVYYNPNDPSLYVERKSGSGPDFNYAQPISRYFTAGLILMGILFWLTFQFVV